MSQRPKPLPPVRMLVRTLAEVQRNAKARRVDPDRFREWLIEVRKDVRNAKRAKNGVHRITRTLTGGAPGDGQSTTSITATWSARIGWTVTIERGALFIARLGGQAA